MHDMWVTCFERKPPLNVAGLHAGIVQWVGVFSPVRGLVSVSANCSNDKLKKNGLVVWVIRLNAVMLYMGFIPIKRSVRFGVIVLQ
tara:strand:- start:297 stop:554 length:258 start_codon:yes stop_codon:yes gene_type:complete